jgi:hypothetical protein
MFAMMPHSLHKNYVGNKRNSDRALILKAEARNLKEEG